MLTSGISLINFKIKKNTKVIKKNLISIITNKNQVVTSLSKNYKNSYKKKKN